MNNKNYLTTAFINVKGVRERDRMYYFATLMRALKISVLALADTNVDEQRAETYEENWPGLSFRVGTETEDRAGVMIIIDESQGLEWGADEDGYEISWSDKTGRCLIRNIRHSEGELNLGVVYAPHTRDARLTWTNEFLTEVEHASGKPTCDVILGDWNMICQRSDTNNPGRPIDQVDIQAHLDVLGALGTTETEYEDGWRRRHPDTTMFTHTNNRTFGEGEVGESRIDRIYVRQDWYMRSRDWRVIPVTHTDHKMVTASVAIKDNEHGKGRWRAPARLIESKPVLEQCSELAWVSFKDILEEIGDNEEASPRLNETIIKAWLGLKNGIRTLLQEISRNQKKQLRSRKHTLELRARDGKRTQTARKLAEEELAGLIEGERMDYCHGFFVKNYIVGEKPDTHFYQRLKDSHTKGVNIPGLKDAQGEIQEDAQGILGVVRDFYKTLYQPKTSNADARAEILGSLEGRVSTDQKKNLTALISGTEVRSALNRAKKGRSPGPDGLPMDLWKNLVKNDQRFFRILTRVMRTFQGLRHLPVEIKTGCLTLLYKKSDPLELGNYRPLSVMGSDYRLYTSILATRLTTAVKDIIGVHQTAFLPERLIGDNIKLIQTLIDMVEADEEDKMAIIFIDQYKGYDMISHHFLWACLRKIGVPNGFISQIKALYFDGGLIPYVNGYKGEAIPVRSGVRQGDPLSCILYVLVIEGLCRNINRDAEFNGRQLPDGTKIKCVCYADDFSGLLKNRHDLTRCEHHLDVWCQAVGAKINWEKTWIMPLGRFNTTTIPTNIQVVRKGEAYKHLGIPVGVDIETAIGTFWEDMLKGLNDKVEGWIKARLSQRARVRVAKTLLISIPRYAITHLNLTKKTMKAIEQIQQKLVWGGRMAHTRAQLTYLPEHRGGLGCQDVGAIASASAINWVARMEKKPSLPWVQLAVEMIQKATRTHGLQAAKARKPWKQILHNKRPTMAKAPSLQHIWLKWWEITGYPGDDEMRPVRFHHPTSEEEVLGTDFWYFPRIFEGAALQSRGVGTWSTETWTWLARDRFGTITTINDIWDRGQKKPKELGGSLEERRRVKKALTTLIDGLPETWKRGLGLVQPAGLPPPTSTFRTDEAGTFQHCRVLRITANNDHEWRPLNRTDYTWAYKAVVEDKFRHQSLDDRITIIAEAVTNRLGRVVRETDLWKAVKRTERVPKANDLLYRLLLGAVRTGSALEWLPEEEQKCPLDGHDQTIEHLFVGCEIATRVWLEMKWIYEKASGGRCRASIPTNKNELIGLLAIGDNETNKYDQIRWHILYSEAVWQIWKTYLGKQFRPEDTAMTVTAIVGVYRTAIRQRIMMDRAMVLSPIYRDERWRNEAAFRKVWGETTAGIVGPGSPKCLSRRIEETVLSLR